MSRFDLDDNLLEQSSKTSKNYEEELKKARALSIRGQKDKALAIYNSILDEDYENEGALLGLLRVHSNNFRDFDSKDIENDIFAIENICPDITDEEYLSYIDRRTTELQNKKTSAPKKENVEKPVESYKPVTNVKKEDISQPTRANFSSKFVSSQVAKATLKPGTTYKEYYSLATKYYDDGDLNKAVSNYYRAMAVAQEAKEQSICLYHLGTTYYLLRKFKEAIECHVAYLEMNPKVDAMSSYVSLNIGECYEELNDIKSAIKYYTISKDMGVNRFTNSKDASERLNRLMR